MAIKEKIAVGIQASVDTLQIGTRKVAEESIRVSADKATLSALSSTTASVTSILGGVGLAAAISAGLSQMEYEDKKRDIRKLYKQELAMQFGKEENKVKDGDVDKMAKQSGVFAEHMKKTKKERNLGIGTIFAATVVSLTVVAAAMGLDMFGGMGTFTAVAVKAVMAMGTYALVKDPLQKVGDRIFNMHEKTAFERIQEIHKSHKAGKIVTKERVFAVFVHANKDLDHYIENKYGKKFDELNIADRHGLTEVIGEKLGVAQITDDINRGRVKATELAFTVEGKASGVAPTKGEEAKHTVLMTIKERLHNISDAIAHPIQQRHESQARKFTERVVRVPREQMGHVQQLEESRAAAALAQRGA